ncbi:MAG: hypothetical protein Kow006_12340 [Gammaproteobacteria bacterium]
MPSAKLFFAIALGFGGLTLSPLASAEGQLSLGVGVQGHSWKEYVNGTDRTLLEETGPRYTMNLAYDTFHRRSEGLVYGVEALGFVGELDYEGTLVDTTTQANSSTLYLGSDTRITLGYRRFSGSARWAFDWTGGLGYSAWGRKIEDGTDVNGAPFSGYTETYSVFYGHLGAGLFRRGALWDQYLQFGFKHPIDITEQVEEPFNVELEPGANTSFYLTWNFYHKDVDGGRNYAVTLYIDSFRFSSSPAVQSPFSVGGNNLFFQPKSDYNVFGLRLTRYFQ